MKHEDLIKQMTLEEKASLMSGKDFWQSVNIDRLNIPSMFLADGPNGIRKQMAAADHLGLNESIKATCFPTACSLASTWNTELSLGEGKRLSREAKMQKVNVLLGPGVNIKRDPRCGRNFEYFSEDPYLAGKIAANLIEGIQEQGNSACIKHFAANSQEKRRKNVDSLIDERALREIYLTQFEIAIKEGKPWSIMSSYNPVNGEYANENHHLNNDILRGEWGFDGFMVSDWGGVDNRVEGIRTGNDLEMPSSAGDTVKDIINAVNDGTLKEEDLDKCVDRIVDLALRTNENLAKEGGLVDMDEHHEYAAKVADEAIVLLENDGVLPLKPADKVAFVGRFAEEPRFQGAGSSQVNAYKLDKILDLKDEFKFEYLGYEPAFSFKGKIKKGLEKKALKLAAKADVVVAFIGLDNVTEAEGLDRENIKIPANQLHFVDQLVNLGKKVVVVLSAGSVIEIPFAKEVNGLIDAYLPGQAGTNAVLRVLQGEVNPSGKLAETFPLCLEDTPTDKLFHQHPNYNQYRESIFVGYRYYDTANVDVLYPFGYGLSYTKFEYSNLRVDENGVTVAVKNVGEVAGKEVVQLYVGMKDSKIFRAKKELKGFAKVEIQPGETVDVRIDFNDYTFRYFNVKTNKWEVEAGKYQLYVAASSADVRVEGEITREGTTDVLPYANEEIPNYLTGNVKAIEEEEFLKVYGREIPDHEVKFYKKKRLIVDYWTTVEYLRYARGWFGRFFAWVIRFAIKLLKAFGNKTLSNTITMGVFHEPMRNLSRMTGGAIHWKQLDGLIMAFNGKFFKGLHIFFKEGRIAKKEEKAKKKMEKANKK